MRNTVLEKSLVGLIAPLLFAASPLRAGIQRLTVYDAGVAQVVEERTVELQEGRNTLEWRSLLPRAFTGTLRVAAEGADVVRQDISYDGPQVQSGAAPVLHVVLVHKGPGGKRRVRIDYLAPNIDWANDYSLVLDAPSGGDPTSAALDSWVSIQNSTGQDLAVGELDLIAGEISLPGLGDRDQGNVTGQQNTYFAREASTPNFLSEAPSQAVSAFQRFALGRDLTLNASTPLGRFPLFQHLGVPIEQRYTFENGAGDQTLARNGFTLLPRGLEVRLVSSNVARSPMPPGRMTIYAPVDGVPQIVGQDFVPLTPAQGQFAVSLGRASTVFGTRRIADRREQDGNPDTLTTRVEIVVTNRGPRAVVAWVREGIERYRNNDWAIPESSVPAERLGAGNVQFKLEVPAGGSATLTYTVVSH